MARETRWRKNDGVYFGYGSDRLTGPPPPLISVQRYRDDRHLVTVGPNGSGKSRRLLVPNLAELTDWSVIAVDPKGELAVMTKTRRAAANQKVIFLNPFNSFGLGSDGFNPLSVLRERDDDFPDDCMGLADALIRVEGKEPHFSQSAQELICALIMYVTIVLENPSLVDVRKMLTQKSTVLRDMIVEDRIKYKGKIINGMIKAGQLADCPELEAKASRFADIGPENRELSSVISTAITQTRWMDSRPVKRDIVKGTFDFSKMKEEKWTVYLILPARRVATHSTWLRLMITSIMQPLMKDTKKAKNPVLFMLDEFAQLGHLPVIEQNMGLMRGFGLKLWIVLQDLAQAKHLYEDRWESFLNNAGVIQSFAPQDLFTAQHLSKLTDEALDVRTIRHMDDGYGIFLSHRLPGTVLTYAPPLSDLPHLADVYALDPSK